MLLPFTKVVRYVLPLAVLVTLLAGGALAALETDTVGSYWDGLLWAIALMTTVGFTGAAPATTGGEIVSAILMVCGFVALAMTTAAVASLFVYEEERPATERERAFEDEALAELRKLHRRIDELEARIGPGGSSPA